MDAGDPGCSIAVRVVERGQVAEVYLTATPVAGAGAAGLFSHVGRLLVERRVEVVQEKIYGLACERRRLLQTRREELSRAGAASGLPLSYVEGRPAGDLPLAGVQIWGIAPRGGNALSIETVECPGGARGRRWIDGGVEMLYLPEIIAETTEGTGARAQAQQMFARADAALVQCGLGYADVIRTWIYLARILDWYEEFNDVRTTHHQRVGLARDAGGEILPASTGIQGRRSDEECLMDLLALRASPGEATVRPIRTTSRQNQAASYGSAFSRGLVLERGDKKTVFVSGTASIDTRGATVHVGDARAQSATMLRNVAALLEDQGGSLRDICTATLICNDIASYDAYRRVVPTLDLPAFPTVVVIADLCRADLLVELEAVAVVGC